MADMRINEVDLLRVMAENEHLRKQRDELQAKLTAWQTESLPRRVRAFMDAIGQEVKHRPEVPETKVLKLRLRLIAEEFFELLAAVGVTPGHLMGDDRLVLNEHIMLIIDSLKPTVDLPELADALSDLRVVIVGTDAAFGINGDAVDKLVMTANEKKLDGVDDKHGKRQKPPGWAPPDISAELRRQGWRG